MSLSARIERRDFAALHAGLDAPSAAPVGALLGAAARGDGAPLALSLAGFVAPLRAAQWVRGVYEAREHWVAAFDEVQFSLGRAWYTDLEEDREATYFREAAASDARVERACPGLQAAMLHGLEQVVCQPVVRRPRWCGPGVHVFPAGGWLAEHGGEVHFDREGLTAAQLASRAPALSLIAMLQPPEQGGGLGMWDILCHDGVAEEAPRPADAVADYALGALLVIDSYRLHQIQPFGGARDRVSATLHAVETRGRWEAWF